MAEDISNGSSHGNQTSALGQSRDVASRLSVTARKLRFSTSNRSSLFKSVSLRPRLIERIFSIAAIGLTLCNLVIPNAISVFYYGYLASDQYQSETRFTVRSSTPALGKDQLGKVTGIPAAKIVQDTQIVTNYIDSQEMLTALKSKVSLEDLYRASSIDSVARLKDDATAEDLLEYWKTMVSTTISPSSGIVTVKVRAFSAESAQKILQDVVTTSETVVNDVNNRIWKDVITTAHTNLDNAAAQLQKARVDLQAGRNQSGVLSVDSSSKVISLLLGNVQKEQLDLQQRYDAQLNTVSASAPQMRVLKREIDSKQKQIDQLNGQIAGKTENGQNLADVSVDISQLEMEQGIAEKQFASSVRTLEQVQFVSKQQLVYLDTFLAPTLPDRAEFPRRGFWMGCILAISLAVWGASLGILSMLRNALN